MIEVLKCNGISELAISLQHQWIFILSFQTPTECSSSRISVYFKGDFGLYCSGNTGCEVCEHWLEVKYLADLSERGPR